VPGFEFFTVRRVRKKNTLKKKAFRTIMADFDDEE
jgi:hypothetical protein